MNFGFLSNLKNTYCKLFFKSQKKNLDIIKTKPVNESSFYIASIKDAKVEKFIGKALFDKSNINILLHDLNYYFKKDINTLTVDQCNAVLKIQETIEEAHLHVVLKSDNLILKTNKTSANFVISLIKTNEGFKWVKFYTKAGWVPLKKLTSDEYVDFFNKKKYKEISWDASSNYKLLKNIKDDIGFDSDADLKENFIKNLSFFDN